MTPAPPKPLPVLQKFRISVPSTDIAPKCARDLVVCLLRNTGHHDVADTAKLLVSELVTNAHQHTTTPVVHMDVTVEPTRIHVAVWDDAPRERLYARDAPDAAEHGRGLSLVEALSSGWGVNWAVGPCDLQKRVWFALDDSAS
ncbi:ATP-binding protein [Streptomyces sp. MST-110588]|nr:ATP-binding protein [Streptomyces sp. MST-110588]